ncbi:MAG: TraR/DksA family transcriptional regulator [Parcubacteria group bacterium]|nr:TraR/DksA family transcriptional regulator [Parcubacteria group bacterium]
MDAKILKEIEAKLLANKKDQETELNKFSSKGDVGREANFQNIGSDEDDNAQEVTTFSDQIPLVAELSKHLEDVEKALKKIKDGTYGICKYCKKEIDPKRLLARPDSGSCVQCKAALQGEVS